MKRVLKIICTLLAVFSLLLAIQTTRRWIDSYRPNDNLGGQHGDMGYVNDYSHYLRNSDGWVSYHSVDAAKGERVVWKIPIPGLVALFMGFPTIWTVIMIRATMRRRARGFEVIAGATNPTDNSTAKAE